MFGFRRYNHNRFTKDLLMQDILLDRFAGPEAGKRAPEFHAQTLAGGEIALSDYRGEKNVVLTFGSATCPFTAASIAGLNELYAAHRHDEVEFLFCYVREAHPGEHLSAHKRFEDKQRAAEILRREEGIEMPVVVDDVNGAIHKDYGRLPNSTFLIDKSGRVAFRSLWTRSKIVGEALQELLQRQSERGVEHAIVLGGEDAAMPSARAMLHAHRALQRGGRQALQDFSRELGLSGRLALQTSRVARPITENPGKSALIAGLTVGVLVGGLFLGRYLRQRRFRARTPYDIESLGMPRRTRGTDQGDYEAVGI